MNILCYHSTLIRYDLSDVCIYLLVFDMHFVTAFYKLNIIIILLLLYLCAVCEKKLFTIIH